ncbi:E3 ubiquitin-protein ligase XBAT33 [Favolaschia claudopus]|uniref:E3 ubiquitin-protein ligase XBAT33 n=1 Tax=Favolaschia claudopus TaxID=2862362 RepID=A0AAW0C0N8_9AGAR
MARPNQPSSSHCLHQAALRGDGEGVRRAIRSGADVNDLDSTGRTAMMFAVAGENWQDVDASNASSMTQGHLQVLRTLLGDSQMSLFTLNAPQMAYRGVTPLGMAAWLNHSDTVRVLIEESAEGVCVDGMDAHGATPLMYAARDGSLDVVKILLRHGARPDIGDGNHRTSVQFALSYPQIVWLCETALRRHRWLESQSPERRKLVSTPASEHLLDIANAALASTHIFEPPPLSSFSDEFISQRTDTLIHSVISSDTARLHSLLFAPSQSPSSVVLVNIPDAHGWSAIHYCATAEYPSISVLDALYCAGSVPSLFTTHEHWTPLHCFAQSNPRIPHDHPELLVALYQFAHHLVHLGAQLAARDKDDESCIHIAAERGNCIEVLVLLLDCDVSGSVRELRNARGLTALEVCKPEFRRAFGEQLEDLRSASALSAHTIRVSSSTTSLSSWIADRCSSPNPDDILDSVDISASTEQLLVNLRLTSPTQKHQSSPFHLNFLENLVREAADITTVVTVHYGTLADEATKNVEVLRQNAERIQGLLDRAYQEIERVMQTRGLTPIVHRNRCTRESEDSEATLVSLESPITPTDAGIPWPSLSDTCLALKSAESLHSLEQQLNADVRPSKEQPQNKVERATSKALSGTTKFKAWMKRKLLATDTQDPVTVLAAPLKLEVVLEKIDEEDVPAPPPPVANPEVSGDEWVNGLLRTSHSSLQAASRDLDRIRECIASAEHFIAILDRCTTRAGRVVDRALKKRQAEITKLRANSAPTFVDDDLFVIPNQISNKSSAASLSSIYSARSSCVSLAAALEDEKDDDIRVIRRLLLRKVDTGVTGANQQLETGINFLRAVKEVVRGAKRRAYI